MAEQQTVEGGGAVVANQVEVRAHTGSKLDLATIEIVARSSQEYREMFGLDQDGTLARLLDTPGSTILDCPGSASSFGAQVRKMAERKGSDLAVVSSDIVYSMSPAEIYRAAVETAHRLLDPFILNGDSWNEATWVAKDTPFRKPSDLLHHRLTTYSAYLEDALANPAQYVAAELPSLTALEGQKFDLIVCGNLLFAYAEKFFGNTTEEKLQFHLDSILRFGDLLNEGGEIRIHPIGTATTARYAQMPELVAALEKQGYEIEFREVNALLKADWDQVMVIRKNGDAARAPV